MPLTIDQASGAPIPDWAKPKDPFAFFDPLGRAVDAAGNLIGGAVSGIAQLPVVGGALQGVGAAFGNTVDPFLGLIEKTAGANGAQSAYQQNAKTLGGDTPNPLDLFATARGLSAVHKAAQADAAKVAADTSLPGWFRAMAGIQNAADVVAQNVLPIPGAGPLGDIAKPALKAAAGAASDIASKGAAGVASRVVGDTGALRVPADQLAERIGATQSETIAPKIGAVTDAQKAFSDQLAADVAKRQAAQPVPGAPANVVQFPGKPSEAVVPQVAAPPVMAPAVGPSTNLGDVMSKAAANKEQRMRVLADKVVRGEPVNAQQGGELLDYLKTVDPANATEYDRMLGAIPQTEAAAKASGVEAKAAQQDAARAEVARAKAEEVLNRTQAEMQKPLPYQSVGGAKVAAGDAAKQFENRPLQDIGQRLDEAQANVHTGYATTRDEQVLKDASINTGKIDDPIVAKQMADTIKANPEGFAQATRTVPLADSLARASDYLGVDPAMLEKELARRGFTAGENASFLVGVNETLVRLGSELHNAASAGDAAYTQAEATFLSFSRSVGGANSEAGRTLNALRMQRPVTFIEAQYAKQNSESAAAALNRAVLAADKAKATALGQKVIAQREAAVLKAQDAYDAAVNKAQDAALRAHTAALTAADRQGLGAGVRKYIASLDPNDVDSVIAAIKATASPSKQAQIIDAINAPKSILASMDLSAPFRQGVFFLPSHPVRWTQAFGTMVHALADEKFANRAMNELLVGKGAARRKIAGVAALDWRSGPLTAREEGFTSNLLGRVPVLGGAYTASNRAYTMFNNILRANLFDDAVKAWDKAGLAKSANEEKALAQLVNWGTGRGSLPGVMNQAAPLLNGLFFAPRFAASTFETALSPAIFLAQRNTRAAKMAALDLTAFVGSGAAILTVLAQNPDVQVEADPRSTKFGEITIGPHTVNIWGGFQTNARYVAQMVTGQVKTNDGRIVEVGTGFGDNSRLNMLSSYLRGKFSPPAALATNVLAGQNVIGQPVTPQSVAGETVIPLSWQDIATAIQTDKENAVRGAIVGGLSLLGFGIQTDQKIGRWGVPNYQTANDPVEKTVRSFATQLDAKGNPLVVIGSLTDKPIDNVTLQPSDLPFWQEVGGKARHDAIAKAISATDFQGLSKAEQAKRIDAAEKSGLAQARTQLVSYLMGTDPRNGGALRVPTTPERQAQGLAIGLSADHSNYDRAQTIYGWRDNLGDPTFRQALADSLPKATKTDPNPPTLDEYQQVYPLLQQVEKMPRFANAQGQQIGTPDIWAQYDAENKQYLAIDKRTDLTSSQKSSARAAFKLTHPVFAQYTKYSPDNPVKNKFIADNPVLKKFPIPDNQ